MVTNTQETHVHTNERAHNMCVCTLVRVLMVQSNTDSTFGSVEWIDRTAEVDHRMEGKELGSDRIKASSTRSLC